MATHRSTLQLPTLLTVNLASLESNILYSIPRQLAQPGARNIAVANVEVLQRATALLICNCHQELVGNPRPRKVQFGQFESLDRIGRPVGHIRAALEVHQIQPGTVLCQQCHQLVVHQGAIPDGQLLQMLELPDNCLQSSAAESVISLGQCKAFKVGTLFGQRKQCPVGYGRTGKVDPRERSVQQHFQQFVIVKSSLDASHVEDQGILD